MPSLYVANTSTKHNEFVYRLPGEGRLRSVMIPAGKQVQVLKDVQREDLDNVINQHILYGIVSVADVKKMCKFARAVYSVDKPVSLDTMEIVMEKNNDIILEEGHNNRKLAAVALHANLTESDIVKNSSLEVEVEEIPEERTVKRKMLREKIKVANDQ